MVSIKKIYEHFKVPKFECQFQKKKKIVTENHIFFNNLNKNDYFLTKLATPMRHTVTHIGSKNNYCVD